MDNNNALLVPAPITQHQLYGIVDTYMRKRLALDTHPAFTALRHHAEAECTLPQIPYNEEIRADLAAEGMHHQKIDDFELAQDGDVQLYATLSKISFVKFNKVSEELYKDAESEKRRLKEAIEMYERSTVGSRYRTNITSDSTHTWEEVLAAVNQASESYKDVPGLWGKIRKGLRSLGSNNQVFEAWADLLPSQSEYFSVLCGGLKLIFRVGVITLRHRFC